MSHNVYLLKSWIIIIIVKRQMFGCLEFTCTSYWRASIHSTLQMISNCSKRCFIPIFPYQMNYLKVTHRVICVYYILISILDAKDILRRMLAPDLRNRASLDLIIYHPWLKPYMHILLPDHNRPPRQQPAFTPQGKKRSRFKPLRQVLLLFLHGPFPPPKKPYRDLSHLGTRDSVFARQRQM